MNTLLLCLKGPMQSWGIQSQYGVRDTGREPSKSGVMGLICAAMGIDRKDDLSLRELTQLRMGVRADQEGRLERDYHTAKDVLKANDNKKNTDVSARYYLADAAFLVGLESEKTLLLEKIQYALFHPVWILFLGRKSFAPSMPIGLIDGLKTDCTLEEALQNYPYLSSDPLPEKIRMVIESEQGNMIRCDQPVSFYTRKFTFRSVRNEFVSCQWKVKNVSFPINP